ncbi:NUC141 domain-containing protein [Schizophyllum amplum]|uniref:U three protein 7 n=1 Tax=Schizophyllum amplum TaxID=97359 RepID=A0A550BXW4_9AGAR|nr:NUC141 domain-containing protein [Auriculariopsis ampla]
MEALIAKAEAIRPVQRKRKLQHDAGGKPTKKAKASTDSTSQSIARQTKLPRSLNPTSDLPPGVKSHQHIANKKLRATLDRTAANNARSLALAEDAEFLLTGESGRIVAEDAMEKTWRVGQSEIAEGAGQEAAKGRREMRLDGGPYVSRYTRNGRHLAIAGRTGHVASFDWQTGQLHTELQLRETCRDVTFLHDHSHFAVAQKKYVYIYDRDGVELHCLKSHVEPTRLEFLPFHWLLATIGNAGYLKYQDTSTGQLVVEHRTKLGACQTMAQNLHNAVIHLGHQNGTVTLWTPNLPHPAVQLLAHLGPVVGLSVDPNQGGRYMATAGKDGTSRCAVREWHARAGGGPVEWSAKGSLAVASGGTVNVYNAPAIYTPLHTRAPPPLYLTHPVPHRPLLSLQFAPYQDILNIGHAAGLSSILVPGAGEPNFDSAEADPFENKKARREKEVKSLLDKLQPDMITLDPEFVGSYAAASKVGSGPTLDGTPGQPSSSVPFSRLSRMDRLRVQGKVDETEARGSDDESDDEDADEETKTQKREEKEKKKMRGKGKSLKRYLRKHRKNVIDPTAIAVRAKLERQREEGKKAAAVARGEIEARKPSALDRFKRPA